LVFSLFFAPQSALPVLCRVIVMDHFYGAGEDFIDDHISVAAPLSDKTIAEPGVIGSELAMDVLRFQLRGFSCQECNVIRCVIGVIGIAIITPDLVEVTLG